MTGKPNHSSRAAGPSRVPPVLHRWLDEQPAPERAELERTWTLAALAREEEPAAEEVEAAWQAVDAALDAPARRPARSRAARRPPRRHALRWMSVAAVVLVLLGAGLWWRLVRPVEIAVPPGRTATVELPDGSTVALNSGSRLTYRRGLFSFPRAVRLEGEAYFDVTKGDDSFTVTTFNARVAVLGTRFNVRARSDAPVPVTTVTLKSGRVRFLAQSAPQRAVTLHAGQQSSVVGRINLPTAPHSVDLEPELAWRSGGLAFSAAPLRAVLDEVERRFDVAIRLEAPALRGDSLSLFLPEAESAEAVLRDVCASLGCRARRTPGGFTLHAEK